ncbi:MAG TPA: hypothetical protein VF348_06610 [Usitatibacter sp.]
MIRKMRFLTALVTVASLLFAQLATAAYSCPMSATAPAAATMAMPCDMEPVDNANLCDNHCQYGSASFDSVKSPPALEQAVDTGLRAPAVTVLAHRMASSHSRAVAPAASPPFVRFTVLRI